MSSICSVSRGNTPAQNKTITKMIGSGLSLAPPITGMIMYRMPINNPIKTTPAPCVGSNIDELKTIAEAFSTLWMVDWSPIE